MRKFKIYIDTSVISNLYADDAPMLMEYSLKLWEVIKQDLYDVVISGLALYEIRKCSEPKLSVLAEYLDEINFEEAELNDEINVLAEKYITDGIIPQKYYDDALHIAAATILGCDAIVSWNFKHMVKLKTIIGVNRINRYLGYHEIEIITPMSMVEEEEE